ncbi:MAG TPA: DUF5640 domain-containing protein [Gemmatimonadaceae bacterium]
MKTQSLPSVIFVTLLVAGSIGAQAPSQSLVGTWRADTPLPNGVVQTFRFSPDGTFDLQMALAVEGTYRIDGNHLIETVTLPSVGVTHTDTATFSIRGDSLTVSDSDGAAPRVLRRARNPAAGSSIVGDWAILLGKEVDAHYMFDADGTMHVHADVGHEQGKYIIHTDTLRLSNNQTFQLPATAQFTVADSVLTLTPPSGKPPRHFHRVALR